MPQRRSSMATTAHTRQVRGQFHLTQPMTPISRSSRRSALSNVGERHSQFHQAHQNDLMGRVVVRFLQIQPRKPWLGSPLYVVHHGMTMSVFINQLRLCTFLVLVCAPGDSDEPRVKSWIFTECHRLRHSFVTPSLLTRHAPTIRPPIFHRHGFHRYHVFHLGYRRGKGTLSLTFFSSLPLSINSSLPTKPFAWNVTAGLWDVHRQLPYAAVMVARGGGGGGHHANSGSAREVSHGYNILVCLRRLFGLQHTPCAMVSFFPHF